MTKARIRALIVDDEPLARVNLRTLLEQEEDWELVGEAGSGTAACEELRRHRADVVFLDIRMPGLSGLEVARLVAESERRPLVVFVTAFEEHALEAFEVEAADYLIKPFSRERFLETLRRLERRVWRSEAMGKAFATQSDHQAADPTGQTLAVRSVGRVRLVEVADIHWVAAAGNYVRLYLAEACYLHRTPLTALERDLDSGDFLRIHRSTLVNRSEVVELRTSVVGRYQVVLRDGTELDVSQRFKQRVFSTLLPNT